MACDAMLAKLDTYLDGEMPAAEATAFAQHLRGCSSCAAEALARVQLKRSLKAAGQRFSPSPAFREAMQRKLGAKPRRRWNFAWVLATSAIALLVAGALFTSIANRNRQEQQLISQLTDLHVATLASSNPVDVVSTDRHTVKPWFQGKIPFTFSLPELQNTEFQLIGGRMAYLNQTPGAQLVYQYRKHYLSVFIFPQQAVGGRFAASAGAGDQNFYHEAWTQGGLSFLVLSDSGQAQVHALAELMRTATAQS